MSGVINRKFFSPSSRLIMLFLLSVLIAFSLCSEGMCAEEADQKADDYDFVFVNNSGWTIRNIWIRHPASMHKGEIDIRSAEGKIKLNNGKLKDGESVNIALPQKKAASYLSKTKGHRYNLSVELPYEVKNYKYWTWRNNDFAGLYKIEITKKDGEPHLHFYYQE